MTITYTNQQKRFYRLKHLKHILGVSGASIWLWVKQGRFPRPIKLSSNTTAWEAEEIEMWIQKQIAQSKQGGMQ